ncbi:MAG: DUF2244 domain-containing protein [Pseudomonadota bacterium]|nr:DUF2244 domain-containing protein [Pseudomonadota bacterium]
MNARADLPSPRPTSDPAAEASPAQRVLELAPHRSLTRKTARIFIALVAAPTFAVALVFTAQGFWPVLPFAGLEIGLLTWAVRASMRSGLQRETITVTQDAVIIRHWDRRGVQSAVFPRHWARVTLHAPPAALHPSRLVLESRGRAREVGRFLTEDERRSLAVRLQQLVGNMNETPAL